MSDPGTWPRNDRIKERMDAHKTGAEWAAGVLQPDIDTLRETLKLALPYVQRVAAQQPTTPSRMQRKMQAEKDVKTINAAIAAASK